MKKVMVIDNHPVMLKYISNLLEKKGHQVITAEDGLIALSILDNQIPDIIFIDMVMPNIGGEKICRIIRRRPKMKDVCLVILSGIAAENDFDFLKIGADACIAKGPFNKMSIHVLNVMDKLEQNDLKSISGKMLGLEDMHRREVIRELLSSKMHSEVILGNMSEGILELSPNGQVVYANQVAVQLIGIAEDDLLAADFVQFFHENHRKRVEKLFLNIYDHNTPGSIPEDSPILLNQKKVALNILPIQYDEHRCAIVIMNDVSAKKQLEDKLRHSQKMEAVATLAGGIAHEFNNALYAISGNIELIQMDLQGKELVDKYLNAVNAPISRMTRLTKQLLAYAQMGNYHFEKVPFSAFVKESLQLLKHSIAPTIHVTLDLPHMVSNVEVDLAQMQIVLSAILTNASEALEGNGDIKISAKDLEIGEDFIQIDPEVKPGPYVCLTIEDNGKGMDEETRKKIFDPFYSTKFHGRGLSMAAAYGIVKNHHGTIAIHSEIDQGSKVSIYLPAHQASTSAPREALPEPTEGTGTILLIEDEKSVMDVTRAMLERTGYQILQAKSGKEAVEIAKGFDGVIDSAILDIGLPDMDGKKVYHHIKEARPELKVIVCSGYSSEGVAKEILASGAQDFIQKPFSFKALTTKLKNMMDPA